MEAVEKINNLLKILTIRSNAKRSYVFELHNSQNNTTGLPFSKFSMTYEYFKPGNRPFIQDYQNMASSTISQAVYELYNNNFYLVEDVKNIEENDTSMAWFVMTRDAASVLFLPIRDQGDKIFGLVGFDFEEIQSASDWTKEKIQETFQNGINRIAGLLDFSR